MKLDIVDHSGGSLRDVEYVAVGPRYDGFMTLQVRKPGNKRSTHIEVAQVKRIVANGRTLIPSSPAYHEPRANELRLFIENGSLAGHP